jgi:hypothetical protein
MRTSRGFTMLLSILVISMILSVALGITDIVIKEHRLSSLVRESEAAFHAADKGIDCALFYHISYDRNTPALPYAPFATSSAFVPPPNMNTVRCNGTQLNSVWTVTYPAPSNSSGLTRFNLLFPDQSCVDVRVLNTSGGASSTIVSEGYNVCDVTSPKRTLRVIEVETNL